MCVCVCVRVRVCVRGAGDRVIGGTVLAVLELHPDPSDPLYMYDNSVLVSGSHIVFDRTDNSWKHVEDSSLAELAVRQPPVLYNLVTTSNTFVVNATTFADWDELPVNGTGAFAGHILATLNTDSSARCKASGAKLLGDAFEERCQQQQQQPPAESSAITKTLGGPVAAGPLLPGARIARPGHTFTAIEDLKPGDLVVGGTVVGVVRLQSGASHGGHYMYNNTTLVTGRAVVLDTTDWAWRHAQDSTLAKHVGPAAAEYIAKHPHTYTLLTTSHRFVTEGGAVWADFDIFNHDDQFYSAAAKPVDVLNSQRV